jgi:hypothetical protein
VINLWKPARFDMVEPWWKPDAAELFHPSHVVRKLITQGATMKQFSYVLAALATIAIAAPAVAQDKPKMEEGMKKPMMKHHHHRMHKHEHKKMMTKKDGM